MIANKMEKIANEFLGPRPGIAICSFWQGIVEVVLRILAPLFGSFPALVTAAVTLSALQGVSTTELSRASVGCCAFVVAITALAILVEIIALILRVCNIGLINVKIKIFLIIGIVITIILAIGHLIGGIIACNYAHNWSLQVPPSNSRSLVYDLMVARLAIISAFCFLAVFLYAFLAAWEIIYLIRKWNDKVIKYTFKDVIKDEL